MSSNTAIATTAKGVVEAIQLPIPTPGADEVVVKVEYASMIPFDVCVVDLAFMVQDYPTVLGFNCAGVVSAIGSNVTELKVGERITAGAFPPKPEYRAMRQYVVASRFACAKIPDTLALEAAATIPDNFITAFYTLFDQLALPLPPSFPASTPPPNADAAILVYGAGSTSGQYAVQLLKLAGYTRVLATASPRNHEYLRSLGATHVFDYNRPTLAQDVVSAAGGKVALVVDGVTAEATLANIARVIAPDGKLAVLLPVKEGSSVTVTDVRQLLSEIPEKWGLFPKSVQVRLVRTFQYQDNALLKDKLMREILPHLLAIGAIKPNRVRLMDQGSFRDRVLAGLDLLRNNKISGEKVVVKVDH